MDYFLNDMQKEFVRLAKEIARKEIRPVAAQYDETGEFPWPIVKAMAETDLFRVFIPEEYEGIAVGTPIMNMASSPRSSRRPAEASRSASPARRSARCRSSSPGSDEQKKKYLPDIAAGNAGGLRAHRGQRRLRCRPPSRPRALKDGDHYILNGTKQWITNGGEAEIYTVFA